VTGLDGPPVQPAPGQPPAAWRAAAERLFGAALPTAERYAQLLSTTGLARGLLGPREAERMWERHLLNSAALALVVDGRSVVDVGSGAGLPGIPLALARPDLRVVLLEPMLRRVRFLSEVVTELGLADAVQVVRGRAPEDVTELPFLADCAVARAVAPLDRLIGWTMPVIRPGGELLALRGATADDEVRVLGHAARRAGAASPEVLRVGGDVLGQPVVVVRVRRPAQPPSGRSSAQRRSSR
jgi:16S rRNA (guanine527-N7)-methyltransferase